MSLQAVADFLLYVLLAISAFGAIAVVTLAVWDLYFHLERAWVARARRWFDVYKYAAIGFGLVVLAGPWVARKLREWSRDDILPADGAMALIIASAALFLAALRARPTAVGKLKYALRFPPWWVAVLLAQLFAWGYWRIFPSTWQTLMPGDNGWGLASVALLTFAGTCVLVGGLLLWDMWRARDRKVSKASKRSIEDWLRDDKPIESADDDKFGHAPIAKRIADRLSSEEGSSAIAVIGGFGSGKSSVRNLTIELLKDEPSIVIVPVSAWPYESASALVTGILERVVGELADRAGWEALRHVPARYREAIEGSAGGWGKLLRVLERPRTPGDVLREIDDVALALGVRVVVWVEDLERYAPVPDDGSETLEAREKLEPVRALLHQLQELENVAIVVATTRLGLGFDLEKLARFIELIPPLEPAFVLQHFELARMDAISTFKKESFLDPVDRELRVRFELNSSRYDLHRIWDGESPTTWVAALVILMRTPRTLKQGLREFRDAWNTLQGEIDVDHALGASILRHAEPKAFQDLVSRIGVLRSKQRNTFWWVRMDEKTPSACETFVKDLGVVPDRCRAVATVLSLHFGQSPDRLILWACTDP